MKFSFRIACVVAFCGLAAGLAWARPNLLSDAGCDFWNLPRLNEETCSAEKVQAEMGMEMEAVMQRGQAKNAIVDALIADEISVAEAFAQFRVLMAGTLDRMRLVLEADYPNISDEELVYQNLVAFAQSSCRSRPDGPAILARLERA